ncbi:VWA domain-containing protein [Polyangium mundeleinium]|uniref:VWA domain-containing protein n=1 Tax=Polyangium mundeleinium TaxID=2995306 RepID=A0ABT5F987_9BACT|nr:VWA domain-containing protein [Polyangium mundeleinium]MDC0749681.1 VWA domain-containing protein [Polyangium mundeleinium]
MAKKKAPPAPTPSATNPPAATPAPAGPMTFDRHQRWRLILGKRVEDQLCGGGGAGMGGRGGSGLLTREMAEMDAALGALYDIEETDPGNGSGSSNKRSAGLGASRPKLAAWLGDVRKYFEQDVVAVIQQDAIEKKGWKELLFEPESLAQITPSVELVGTLLTMKDMIPDRAKDAAREIVRAVVEEIKKRMQGELERAVRGALDRSRHQPIPSLPNLDWRRTIGKNLKNYQKERRTIVPDRFFFFARQHRRREWNVIVAMDQSGSMASSVVYGGVMGSILASLPALETHVVAFDTEVVDLTPRLVDPVDLIFGIQLGGGTDINRAVGYCQGLVSNPRRTLFILLTDLYEGGNQEQMVKRMEEMVQSGVRAMCLLALDDSGTPMYDAELAKKLAKLGVPCFACTPNALPPMLEAALKGHDLEMIARRFDARKAEGRDA